MFLYACMIALLCNVLRVWLRTRGPGGMALQRNPEAGLAMVEAGWEVASHG